MTRRRRRLGLVLSGALLLAAPTYAQASRPATQAEHEVITRATGITPACALITFSTVDPSFAVQRLSSAGGCPGGNTYVVMQATAAGAYQASFFGSGRERCPIEGIPTAVAVDLGICAQPPPKVYLTIGKKFSERPSSLRLTKRRTITKLRWSKWGGTTAQARGSYRKSSKKRSVKVTVSLSGRETCSDGRRIYTRIKISAPRGSGLPFARGGRWAKCPAAEKS